MIPRARMIVRAREELLIAVLGSGGCRQVEAQAAPPIMAWDGYDLYEMSSVPKTPKFEPSISAAPPGVAELVPPWLAESLAEGPVVFMEPEEWNGLDPAVQGYMDVLKL